jgi:hypothetical protein
MPAAQQLPQTLAALARRNALVISDLDWKSGINRLVATLDGLLAHEEEPPPPVGVAAPPTYEGEITRYEQEQEDEARGAGRALTVALELVGAALLVVGTALRVDERSPTPTSAGGDAPNLGFFTSLAPMGLAVGALGALALSHTRSTRRLGVGLLLGFSLGGVAKCVGLLGIAATQAENAEASGPLVLALIGAGVLATLALRRALVEAPDGLEAAATAGAARSFVVLGAALVVAGTLIPFNDAPALAKAQVLVERSNGWEALDPIVGAVIALVAAWLLTRSRGGIVAAGTIIAVGLLGTLLWLRYVGVPALQPDEVGSPRAGGFIGLAGAGSILFGGLVAGVRSTKPRFAGRVSAGPAR